MNCPKCQIELQPKPYMGYVIQVCSQCEGALINQKELEGLLTKVYDHLIIKIEFNGVVEKLPDKGQEILCPKCQAIMDQHGYMGDKNVMIDLCQMCELVFADKGEIGVMALLIGQLKKTNEHLKYTNVTRSDSLAVAVLGSWIYY